MKRPQLAMAALVLFGLVGCSTQQTAKVVDACAGVDWWEMGRTDGVSGQSTFKLDDHKSRCSTGGATVDVELYLNGRDAGLIDYCTPQQGFIAGRAGVRYENVCPLNLEQAFLKAYETGARLNALESQDLELESRISNLSRLLSQQQAGPAVRAQVDQLRNRRAEVISEISKLEKTSGLTSSM